MDTIEIPVLENIDIYKPMEYKILHAYIDESGENNLNLDKNGTSKFFVAVATLVEEENIVLINELISNLKKEMNRLETDEFKSSSMRSIKSRKEFLSKIAKLPINFYVFIVDKKNIKSDSGLVYKSVFYKYINKIFYQKIAKDTKYDKLKIFADEIGSQDFRDSFSKYLKKKRKEPTLFERNDCFSHSFEDSKENNIIQISDIVAGTILKHYTQGNKDDEIYECFNLIESKVKNIHWFPYRLTFNVNIKIEDRETHEYQENICKEYLDEHGKSIVPIDEMRLSVLEKLMVSAYSSKSIFSDELENELISLGHCINTRKFRKDVIGGLRMYGIIITGSNKGYRLAITKKDVDEYLKYDEHIIFPMLEKVLSVQNKYLEKNKKSLLSNESILYKILEVYKKEK